MLIVLLESMNAKAAILRQASARTPDWADETNRILHQAIADKIRRDPELLAIALENLRNWKRRREPDLRPSLRRWKLILLSWELDEILGFMTETTGEAIKLRRFSPFCGILTEEEKLQALTAAP